MKGGARSGSGRKPADPMLKKNPISIKLPQWLIEWLDAQPASRAVTIEQALCKSFEINPPKSEI